MKNKNTPIAIVAVSSILPGSNTTDLSWKHIQDGKDFIREVPSSHWLPEDYYDPNSNEFSKIYAKTGAFLSDIPFDPVEFNMPPNTLASTDTNQLLALIAAKRLMLSTRSIREKKVDPKKISIILGIAAGSEMQEQMSSKIQKPVWKKVLLEHGLQGNDADRICASIEAHYPDWTENTFPGLLSNVVAGRVANKLNLGGCNFVTDAACASSLAAINMAMLELQGGRSDIVFSGGVDALSNIFMYMCFTKTPALSPTGDIRPFSNEGDGTILGEGVALFALRRLEDAERDGDEIHAVINACGSSSDGKFKSIYAPSPEGQSRAINNAYESLDYGLGSVELIEAHGTGTKAGDAAEFEGLRLAFANDPTTQDKDPQYCALGSIKSQIGHAKSTAGGAGLLKAMFALRHKVLPPTIKVKTPNDKLDIHNSSLYLNTETRPWIKRLDQPRRAAVSSFGFGGSNFHLAVEEYTGAQQPKRIYAKRDGQEILLTLSATTPAELVQNVLKLKEKASGERTTLLGLARASHAQVKEGHAFRLSLLAKDKNRLLELVRLLEGGGQIAAGKNFTLPGSVYLRKTEQLGKTAFLFAGQGGQYLNMGRDLLCQFDQARAPWDECCSMNSDDSSTLAQVVYPLPVFTDEARRAQEAELSEIQWIQPALGALSLSHLEMLNAVGVKADAFAGHSYGELPALYAAGAISSKQDLMEISAKRAELMKRAVALPSNRDNPGGMSAVLESPQSVSQLLEGFNGEVGLANLNSPKQTVITGSVKDIARFEQILAENQISFKRLNVPTAFHSPWVASVSEDFKAYLDGKAFNLLEVPLFSNLTGERYPAASDGIRRELSEQVAQQVRFVDEIEKMKAFGVTTFIEMGPGKALSQMVKDTLGDAVNAVSMDLGPKVDSVSAFWRGIGELSALGVPMDLAAIWDAFAPEENEPRQEDYSKATIMINGANYGKVYPAAKSKKSPLPEPVKLRAATVAAASEPFKATVKDEPRFAKPIPPTPPTAKSHAPSQTERFMTNSSTDNKPSTERINKARPSSEYLVAIQTIQETAFQAQQAFQRTLAQSHQSYLESTQSVLASLAGSSMAGRSAPVRFEQTSSVVAPPIPAPTFVPAAPVHVAAPTSAPAPTPAMLQPQRPVHHPVKSVEPVTPAPSVEDFTPLLLKVVADKTGYPEEMLGLDLDMESGLGIDSIKRVEILSALQESIPALKDVDTTKLAAMNTLAEILAFSNEVTGNSNTAPVASPASQLSVPSAASVSTAEDFTPLLLKVVADKTGYPEEMLGLDLDMESGLGIDSIKRVEILSALQESIPALKDVDTTKLAAMNTLAEILAFANEVTGNSAAPASQSVITPSAAEDFTPLLLKVVAEKTGYPEEMLGLDVDMESGLGIDSIKRVEILSALQESIPALKDVDTTKLATMNTLAEILAFANEVTGNSAAPAGQSMATPSAAEDFTPLLLKVVAEKTGYPEEMLGLEVDMESGLGIDSIKRVEILSALQEHIPALKDVDTTKLAAMNTLAEILAFANGVEAEGAYPKSERDGNTAQEIPPAVTQEKTSFRYPVTRTARSLSGIAVAGLNHPAPITIVPDSQGIAQLLAEKLEEAGLKTAIKSFNDCCAQPGSRVIYLEGLSPETENWEEVNYRAFSLAKQTPILQENESGLFVCVHQSSKGMAQSYASGLSALIKTANKEWEGYGLKSIDLLKAISPEEACQIIFRELVAGGAEVEVAYESPCKRFVYESPDVEVEVSFDNAPIQQHDVWVVSGGLKGVTAECLVTFVKKTPLKLAILGRSELQKEPAATLGIQDDTQLKRILLNEAKSQGKQITPIELMAAVARVHSSREMAFNLKRLQDAGAVVEYFSCDIGDLPSVERCLDQVRSKLGSINGIIHGAGVLADKLIRDKTEAQYRRVFNTKVNGFKNLLQLTHADPVNVICCFASVAARTGNVGQCDYAMANEVLNKVCRMEKARRLAAGTPCVVKSINWGPWDGGMVSPQLKSHFESLGIGLLPLEAGANAFVDELYEAPGGEVEVVIGGAMDNWALGKALPFQELDLYIHPDLQPWLLDHKIKGSVVVPAMMVSEWFLNAGEIALGKPVAIHDFKVIKGIMLGAFDAQGSWCLITVKQNSDGCDVRLASATGTIHYSSRAVALDATVSTTLNAAKDESVIAEGAWRIEEVYPRCLFHGPAFQVVEQLLHVSPQTATASLKHANPLSSSLYDWKSDVAIMDGGLQLALLWAMEQSDKDTLPTGYKSLMVNPALGGSHVGEAIFTQFTPRSHNGFRTCGDLLFSNAQGEVIAAIHGLEISSATSDLIYRSAKGLV